MAGKEGFLTQAERDKLAIALWGSTPDYQTLPNINLAPHAFLLLPTADEMQVGALVRRQLYEHGEEVLKDTQKELRSYPSPEIQRAVVIYAGMANAAANETTRLFPTPEQALALFDRLVMWRPQPEKDDFFGMGSRNQKQLTESIGNAISYAIMPALSIEAKTVERLEQLQAFYSQLGRAITLVPAFVYFAHLNEQTANVVEKIIRKALQGRDAGEVSYAAIALQKWVELSGATGSSQIKSLISKLITIIESGRTVGLQQLLWVAGELLNKQSLSEEQVATLIEALPNAFNAADYTNIEPNSQEAKKPLTHRAFGKPVRNWPINLPPYVQTILPCKICLKNLRRMLFQRCVLRISLESIRPHFL